VFKVREKRFGFRVPCIKVPIGAAVSYEDNTIRVFRGNEWLYKFRGIRVFQVYNRAAGFLLFSGSAGGTVFRGYGKHQKMTSYLVYVHTIGCVL